jgi:prepilin-type N-terminal cleavage/methylation domain-containing protein
MKNRRRRGFTLIELLIVIAIVLTILTIALPKVGAVLMNAREMAAIKQMQTIHTAQTQFYSQFGKFATKLEELGPPPTGQASPAAADLLPGDLAKGIKSGYQFTLQGGPAGYTINANPVTYNSTGRRCFFSDQTQVYRENWGPEPATPASNEIK